MTDISKMLRDEALNADMDWTGIYQIPPDLAFAAADRIEKLEAALREIVNKDTFGMDWAIRTARKALEGKDD